MTTIVRRRFWLEAACASACGLLAVLTLVWRDWIEGVTGLDPDHHNGSLEWAIVGALVLVCAVGAARARAEGRRPVAAAAEGSV
jgi:hypothetical protein